MFMPDDAASDRSTGIGVFQPPVFEIDTFDEFAGDHLLFMGRPLWKMNWFYRHESDYKRLVEFAGHKLCHPGSNAADGRVALFLCRFGLNPTGDLAIQLVASHMATYGHGSIQSSLMKSVLM